MPKKAKKQQPTANVRDLKPKKDAKGGLLPAVIPQGKPFVFNKKV